MQLQANNNKKCDRLPEQEIAQQSCSCTRSFTQCNIKSTNHSIQHQDKR